MASVTSASDRDFDTVIVGVAGAADRPEPIGSRLDAWWARMLCTPARRRAWDWGGPIAVTLLAAVLRLWNLGDPHSLVFDETYYVKDAYTLQHLGYEGAWPANADEDFNAGRVDTFTKAPTFVVHPPLGKWLISLGLAVFGAESSVGWRITTAIIGILAVALICVIAKSLFSSTLLATIAGFLMAIDGNAIVMSRVALLDNSVMFFVLLGFGAVLLDRRQSAGRLAAWLARRADAGRGIDWGPALWWRPWLVAAWLAFGAATAVKWNGAYFLAGFALYTLAVDAAARRRAGITFWGSGTLLKQGPASFLLMVPIALAAFLTSWTGWFVTSGGYYRHWAEEAGHAWTGLLSWVPLDWQSFWHYQAGAYAYNVGLHQPHSYQANPLTWLFQVRPTAMYYSASTSGCGSNTCGELITGLANPLVWWAAVAAAFYLVYRLVRHRQWQLGAILAGVAAGYLPWLMYLNRTVFQFYTIAFEPYLILGLVFVISLALGSPADPRWRRVGGIRLVAAFLVLAALLSAFFYPVWTGMRVPTEFLTLHYWLPTWR
jgi:dolichyl-phosphate-mannose-protein mannosyltransferase